MKLVFATQNLNKTKEVELILPKFIQLVNLADIHFSKEIEETEHTLEGNALLKARTVYNQTNLSCFSDDSGLLVEALHGEPGVYSARYAGEQKDDEANMRKLLGKLSGIKNRNAAFKTVMALIINGKEYIFEGIVNGQIGLEKAGNNGFGYDPLFIPDGYSKTFAQMTAEEKSLISHRKIALSKLIDFLSLQSN